MTAPAIAAINARIARTAVNESGLPGASAGTTVAVTVAERAANAVRVARIFASCVAAPGEGVAFIFPDSGVTVPVPEDGPSVVVGTGEEVLVMVWKGEVGVGVNVLVGVSDLMIFVDVGYFVEVRVGVFEATVRVIVGVLVRVEVAVDVAGLGVTEIVPVSTVVPSRLSTFKR